MFGTSKLKKTNANRISTIIGPGTEIQGNIKFSGGLHVDGTVKGNIEGHGGQQTMVSVSEKGKIEGEVKSPVIFLNGKVEGNVFATEKIELAAKSKVTGDVTYALLEMEVGAEINGRLVRKAAQNASGIAENVSAIHAEKTKGDREKEAKRS